jgi:hypothetical protein
VVSASPTSEPPTAPQPDKPDDKACGQIPALEEQIRTKSKTREFFATSETCETARERAVEHFKKEGSTVETGGYTEPAATPETEAPSHCNDHCQWFPEPICRVFNDACRTHEDKHVEQERNRDCSSFPSLCERDRDEKCPQEEDEAYGEEIEFLKKKLEELKKACTSKG